MIDSLNHKISIIVPLYKGTQYVEDILKMYHGNVCTLRNAGYSNLVELVIVNDYPNEKIILTDDGVNVVNNEINIGIQNSRVKGINICVGEYVVMLDQDDYITSDFLLSQLQAIGTDDVVVCNGIHNNWPIFDSEKDFEVKMNDIGTNYIISPGQVFMKKTIIPSKWGEDIMKCSGTDDYYLWILMVNNGVKFKYNHNKLFKHIKHDKNVSNDMKIMKQSNEELIEKIEKNISDSSYKNKLIKGIQKTINENEEQMTIEKVFEAMREDVGFILKVMRDRNCTSISIYGFGNMGQRTYNILKQNGVNINFILDKKAPQETMKKNYNLINPCEETLKQICQDELIIVTPIKQANIIKDYLLKKGVKNVISLLELNDRVENI